MHKVIIATDPSCEMAYVELDGKCVMEGNYWDFHNGCHGIHEYGRFNSITGLVAAIERYYAKKNERIEIERIRYKYAN